MPSVARGIRPRKGRVYGKKEVQIKASMMLAQKLLGYTQEEIAKMFRCSEVTVERRLAQARRENLYGTVETLMTQNLIPKAILTFDQALDEGDVDVAKDVLYGTGILRKSPPINVEPGGELTIDVIRTRILNAKKLPETTGDSQSEPPTIDAEVTEVDPAPDGETVCEGVDE